MNCMRCGAMPVKGLKDWAWIGVKLPAPMFGATHQVQLFCPKHVQAANDALGKEKVA